jgi:hypothetical protein
MTSYIRWILWVSKKGDDGGRDEILLFLENSTNEELKSARASLVPCACPMYLRGRKGILLSTNI